MKAVRLSPSALNIYADCPRCFWLDKVKRIRRPRGIFPSLPSGMDRVIKDYFDTFRSKGELPPELQIPEFAGVSLFEDQNQLDLWRDWKTGPVYQAAGGSQLFGALDDLLVRDGRYIPFDYKTKGSPTTQADAEKYYQRQLDCYALMIEAQDLQTAGYGYLLYYSPKDVREEGNVRFEVQPIKIKTDPGRAAALLDEAVEFLKGPIPGSAPNCEYCAWLRNFKTPFK